ncbi:MAG: DeoR family transcriptional regulator [Candidatus Peregrinibacteria bacterium]|nr:DeoR family transcriptional regulator [Candidatus Peregrinibacteria bacterium]MDZ4245001.1 DeoR family transcriptional regulator [Candidatus Gracilibacteria bacterium]
MDRRIEILRAIVEQFIQTAEPVGSKSIVVRFNLNVSPATIRNDMATLEKEGLIFQPHTSAGRIPTDQGYRLFVNELADYKHAQKIAKTTITHLIEQNQAHQAKQKLYEAMNILSQAVENLCFATVPNNERAFFLGTSKILRNQEFLDEPMRASQVIEVLENGTKFRNILKKLPTDKDVKIFIGKENLIKEIESCSIIVTEYELDGFGGHIGILGPTRMSYAYNKAVLEEIKNML